MRMGRGKGDFLKALEDIIVYRIHKYSLQMDETADMTLVHPLFFYLTF